VDKLAEAQAILKSLGLPQKQQSVLTAYVLLSVSGIQPHTLWSDAKRRDIGIHAMIQFISEHYGKKYAENTRESFRKNVLRPLEQARVIDKNQDDPSRPTNSPHNVYCLSQEALTVLQSFQTLSYDEKVKEFIAQHGALAETYQAVRIRTQIPVIIPNGDTIHLSAGKHNDLQKAVLELFAPQFAPGSKLLYLGDTAKKDIVLDKAALDSLGISHTVHDKFPDIILYLEEKKWLFLIEAVTSHGPISSTRLVELRKLIEGSPISPVFVTAFLDIQTFKKFAAEIAWETEVWIKESPTHLIHFNGDKFLGPPPPSNTVGG